MRNSISHASRSGAPARRWPPLWAACLALLVAATPGLASAQEAGSLGVTVDSLLAAGRRLSPSLRAAALETAATAAKAEGADALDAPSVADSYQYYRNPNVFSGHAIMLTQAFPLWGKRDLRRRAALAEVDAARGREHAAQNELDERIKVAFARYYVASRALAVNREVIDLTRGMRNTATARYGTGRGDATRRRRPQSPLL
jgi:cobalt-zinc-cadmium efflux system outer membrane protein